MLFFFNWLPFALNFTTLIWLKFTLVFPNLCSECFLPDIYQRLISNNFFFNNLYFFWTSLWYLPVFILVLFSFFVSYKQGFYITSALRLIIILYSLVYYAEFLSNVSFNSELVIYGGRVNNLLLNSVNKIHPLLLYTSGSFFIIFFNYSNFNENFTRWLLLSKIKYYMFILFFTLYLGGWWALQEGSWGGWWNWDTSEVFGLFIGVCVLNLFHGRIYLKNSTFSKVYFNVCFLKILLFYLFIQLNFNLISHNFGFQVSKFILTEAFLFNWFIFLVLYTQWFMLSNFSCLRYSLLKWVALNFYKFVLQLVFSGLIFLTFNTVINDFIWVNLGLNIFNTPVNFNYLILIIFFMLKYALNRVRCSLLTIYFFFLLKFTLPAPIIITFRNKSLTNIMHYFILYLVFVCVIYSNIIVSLWENLNTVAYTSRYLFFNKNSIGLGLGFNLIESTSTPESKSFYLLLNKHGLFQTFLPTSFLAEFSIMVEDSLSLMVSTFIFVLIFLYWVVLNKKTHF